MTHTTVSEDPDGVVLSIDLRVDKVQSDWKEEAKALTKLAAAFGPLAKPTVYQDLSALPGLLEKVEAKIRQLPVADRGSTLLEEIRADLLQRKRSMQERLAKDLQAACKENGLELRVLRREEPVEVRIPPFAVRIDRTKGHAELLFARQRIATCEAAAGAILTAHGRALEKMHQGFHAERFFDACLTAWRAACGAGSAGAGDRVEILDFLPYLALQLQSSAFRIEPSERNFRGYSRARFAFDMLSVRKAGTLSREGWRMNLGVATGTTATKKNRTLFFEDENGDGEHKLTVFFTRAETQ